MSETARRIVLDRPFDRALHATVEALAAEDFSVAATDVQRLLRHGADEACRRYVLLTVLQPELVRHALAFDLDAGTVLPYHIAIYELADGRTAVSAGEPMAAVVERHAWQTENPALARVAFALEERLGRALSKLARRTAGCTVAA